MLKEQVTIIEQDAKLSGTLEVPPDPAGLTFLVKASGSGEDPLIEAVARPLRQAGVATITLDLLTSKEAGKKENAYNIKLLALRLEAALDWAAKRKILGSLPLGVAALETASAAAMSAAAHSKHELAAIASIGGRIDLAEKYLPYVEAPTLLIVGSRDELALMANKKMLDRIPYARLHVEHDHGRELGPEASQDAARTCVRWFKRYFNRATVKARAEKPDEEDLDEEDMRLPFYDRLEAAQFLARRLKKYQDEDPLILAIPRGAAAMAQIISRELRCEMDVTLVKKIGAPGNPELAIGSVNEFGDVYLNSNAAEYGDERTISALARAAQRKLARYRKKLGGGAAPRSLEGRTVIIVDDGVATGSTMLSAIITAKEHGAAKVVAASPVASPRAAKMLELASDETVFLAAPEEFYAVAQFYENFPQASDEEVERVLSPEGPQA